MLFNYPLRPKTEADNTLQDLPNFFFTMQKPNPVIAKRLSVAFFTNWDITSLQDPV